MKHNPAAILAIILFASLAGPIGAQDQEANSVKTHSEGFKISRWSVLAGLDYIINTDGEDLDTIPGMQDDGSPGGLNSGPSPLKAFFGIEYRLPVHSWITFAPSGILYAVQYRFEERPLPVEIENRTAFVPSILLDLPFVATFYRTNFCWSAGLGASILMRWAFLELDVPADAMNTDENLTASEQVSLINAYNWDSARWLYPTIQAGIKYRLETGWAGGLTLRAAFPIFNLWSTPKVPFSDSLMLTAALTITPPEAGFLSKKKARPPKNNNSPADDSDGATDIFLIE